ncbi:hypothetical protein QBC40DRAFT_176000 [Triangularia verruculosa]|uniref:Uncharacterized protein n=1 Tax=Triangularia verruculosa TaxID=2587418 RepID=A0AAN6XFD1_9PEZI|nr:hypothetical protein QBC40DRAFT_176000 [Triangularia verruculosa]
MSIASPAGSTTIINPDLTLLIAEDTDLATLLAVASTNKHLHALIHTYEHSIIKSRINAAIPDPSLQPPFGSLLSSNGPTRQILPPWSFQVAAELERRHSRIETMFNNFTAPPTPLISAMYRVPSFAALPPPQFLHLVTMFKQACQLADQISDLALFVKIPVMARDPPPADPYSVQKAIHRTRQAYIKQLSPLELAALTHLAALGGMAYAEEFGEMLGSDPNGLERIVAFKETIFREGSFALWAFLHPEEHKVEEGLTGLGPPSLPPKARSSGLGRYIGRKVEAVLGDIWAYEQGLQELDGVATPLEVDVPDWDKEGARDGMEDDDEDPFVVLHGLHQTVMAAFPKPIQEPEEDDEDDMMGEANSQSEDDYVDYEEGDLSDEDEQTQEEVETYPADPRAEVILEAVRSAIPC